ncbi:hypothetical protein BGW39_006442 [Mortierella sp. 14UC]|nr:hypothetical protein BGW39_006442 [Mortierella sp. 14UC]
MSWKGLTKAVSRLPHTLGTKTGIRDATTDHEFKEMNNNFTASEKSTTLLLAEVCRYRDSVTALLNHQAEFGIILAEIYDPSLGVPSGEVTPRRVQTAPESVQAVDDFQAVMREIRDLLLPEVDKLEATVVRPLTEMQTLMKMIRKTIVKRDHKLVDYDRYRISLKKLQDKKDRKLSDEKEIFKLESLLEVATADYEGLNNLLKEELPGYFWLRTQLMEPIFHSFFYLQLRIYNILLDRIDPLSKSGYYDLTMDVLQGYEARKDDITPTLESVEIITKRAVATPYASKYGRPAHDTSPIGSAPGTPRQYGSSAGNHSPPVPAAKPWQSATAAPKPWQQQAGGLAAASASPPIAAKPWQAAGNGNGASRPVVAPKPWQTATAPKPWQAARANQESSASPPPAYASPQTIPAAAAAPAAAPTAHGGPNVHVHLSPFSTGIAGAVAATAASAAYQHGKTALANKKPPPPPVPKRLGVKMVVALYDYDAQQDGDLSFRKDDRIEIVERTASTEDWWTGKLNGRQGVFPDISIVQGGDDDSFSYKSRLIIKNLPKHLTDERFREHFSSVGEVTDAKLMKSSFGNSRRFGFIGYKTDKDAKAALAHFNNTFIDTSKIIVEKAKEIGDDSLPRAWSQHTIGTSAHARKMGIERQKREIAEATLKTRRENEADAEMKKKKEHLAKLYQAENDPKLREYLEVMQPRATTKTWANDDAVELNTEKVGHGRENNRAKARAQVVALKNRKPGGEGLMVTQTKITFEDSDDELYDNLPIVKTDAKDEGADIEMLEAPKEDNLVNDSAVSDLDWLKSRMAKPADAATTEEKEATSGDEKEDEKSDAEASPAPAPKIAQEPPNRPVIISAEEEEEQAKNLIADTGRLFVRNLPYTCTEDDLRKLFEKFGPLSEVHMPISKDTKKPKGYAYVLYLLPEHAIKAYSALDKKFFMGRLLHILASKEKPQPKEDEDNPLGPGGRPLSIKKQRELKKKGQSGMDFNWNSLYMNSDAIAASIADRLNVSKADILNPDADNMGVRLAVAETQIIMETKKFLEEEGINVDSFGKKERSDTVILVKNIPFNTTEQELQEMFGSHGDLGRVLMPPAKTIAIVEFLQPSEARSAFSHLAYRRFKDTILYLEKAPVGVFSTKYDPEMKNKKAERKAVDEVEEALSKKITSTQLMDATTTAEGSQDADNLEGATLFIKNINFKTTDEGLRKAFANVDGIKSTLIRYKPDPKNPGKTLSMGFGFAEFVSKDKAMTAMKAMNGFILDGSKLEIKFSDRSTSKGDSKKGRVAPKDHGTKLLIRNIPFEATKKDIQGLFSSFGQLKSVRIPKKMSGGHRGFAFLDFMTKQEAKNVYENVSSTHLLGRHLVVEWAEEDSNLDVLREKVGRQFRKDDGHGSGKRRKIDLDGDDDDMMMEDD